MRALLLPLLGLSLIATAGLGLATQTCDPVGEFVCTGNSGSDLYAHCDGTWADVYGNGEAYAQVCAGNDGTVHVCVEEGYDGNTQTCSIADQHIG